MDFDWDESKRLVNRRKHGIDFVAATAAFADPRRIETVEFFRGEERWRLIGLAPEGVLYIVYVERGEVIRIISARKATRGEARTYYEGEGGRRPSL